MLPKQNRLKKKKDFDRVFNEGSYLDTPLFLVKSAKNNLKVSRFGFVVSKKVSPKAVERNRIKRIMREVVRKAIQNEKELDIIFISKPTITQQSFFKIQEEINKILNSL